MKNRTQVMEQRSQIKVPDWLFQETQEDDFLMGRVPKDLSGTWEEEE
jgi:hypothetical protein